MEDALRPRLGVAKTNENEGRYRHHRSRGPVPIRAMGSDGDVHVLSILCVVVDIQCVVDHLVDRRYKSVEAMEIGRGYLISSPQSLDTMIDART